jgi:hypothetical protein
LFLGGGRGGGKSFTCLLLALRHVEQYGENARVLIIRRDFPSLRDLEGEARNLFRTAYGKSLGHNQADHVFKFPSGAVVRFDQIEGVQDFHKYQGQSFSLIVADEAGQWADPQPLDMLRSSLRSKAGVPCRMILSANPGGPGHQWIMQRHIAGVCDWTPYVDRASQREFITAPSVLDDNPHLPDDYRRQIEAATATDPELRKAWVAGDWYIQRGAFFGTAFEMHRNVVEPWLELPAANGGLAPWKFRPKVRPANVPEPPRGWEYWIGGDHGSAAPSVFLFFARSPGGEGPDGKYYPNGSIVIFDECAFYDPENLNQGLHMTCEMMAGDVVARAKEWGIKPAGVLDDACFAKHGSQSGTLASEYQRAGLIVQRARKGDRLSGWQIMRRMMADAGRPDRPGLYVSKRCRYWLETVPFLDRDVRRPEDLDTRGPDHGADATRYGLLYERPTVKAVPVNWS